MSPIAIATISVLIVATFISALISALETALFSLKEHHVIKLTEAQPELRKQMVKVARYTRKNINEVLFLSSVANMTLAILGFYIIREAPAVISGDELLNAVAILGSIIFFGDLLPKLFALVLPELVFRLTIRPFLFLSPMLEKFVQPLAVIAEKIGKTVLPAGPKPIGTFSDPEVETLVQMKHDEGTLTSSESEIIQDVIRLGNKTTKDCLTPRTDTFMLSVDDDPEEAAARIREQDPWQWKIPVYENDPDTVIGLLDVRRFLHSPDTSLREATDAALFIPETASALDTFRRTLNNPRDLAVVVDEYGGMEGMLGYDHFVEELFGDAAPAPDSSDDIVRNTSREITVSGDTRLEDVSDEMGIVLEHEGLDTIGGLVFTKMGYLPEPGATIVVNGVRATVNKVEGTRIKEVNLEIIRPEE